MPAFAVVLLPLRVHCGDCLGAAKPGQVCAPLLCSAELRTLATRLMDHVGIHYETTVRVRLAALGWGRGWVAPQPHVLPGDDGLHGGEAQHILHCGWQGYGPQEACRPAQRRVDAQHSIAHGKRCRGEGLVAAACPPQRLFLATLDGRLRDVQQRRAALLLY